MGTVSLVLKFAFLIQVMLFVGISVTTDGFLEFLRGRAYVKRLILANLVVVPLLGLGLAFALPIPAEYRLGIVFVAAVPGGFNALQFTSKVEGEASTAAGATLLLTAVGLIAAPAVAAILGTWESALNLPYGTVIWWLLSCCVAPIAAGALIRSRLPAVARTLAPILNGLSTLCFIGAVLTTMAYKKSVLPRVGGSAVVAVVLLVLGAHATGWFMGGSEKPRKGIAATVTSNRNAPLCLLFSMSMSTLRNLDLIALAFLLFVIPINLGFAMYGGFIAKKAKAGGATGPVGYTGRE